MASSNVYGTTLGAILLSFTYMTSWDALDNIFLNKTANKVMWFFVTRKTVLENGYVLISFGLTLANNLHHECSVKKL